MATDSPDSIEETTVPLVLGGDMRARRWSNIFPDHRRPILVDSAIDALSFHQVHSAHRVRPASTADTLSDHRRDSSRKL